MTINQPLILVLNTQDSAVADKNLKRMCQPLLNLYRCSVGHMLWSLTCTGLLWDEL